MQISTLSLLIFIVEVTFSILRKLQVADTQVENHNGRSSKLTLQVPPRPTHISRESFGEHLSQNHGYSGGSPSIRGEGPRLSRVVSFKNEAIPDGERSSLLNPQLGANPDNRTGRENYVLANIVARLSWKRCDSLPAKSAAELSPSPTSAQERTCTEQHVSQVGFLSTSFMWLVY